MSDKYYYVGSSSMDGADTSKRFSSFARASYCCAECGMRSPDFAPVDIELADLPSPFGLDAPWGGRVGMIHDSLLELLPSSRVQADLMLGNAFVQGRSRNKVANTFIGKCKLVLRGNAQSTHKGRCRSCRRALTFGAGDKTYLVGRPPSSHHIFESRNQLIVRDYIADLLHPKAHEMSLDIFELPIEDHPLDGTGFEYPPEYLTNFPTKISIPDEWEPRIS